MSKKKSKQLIKNKKTYSPPSLLDEEVFERKALMFCAFAAGPCDGFPLSS